MPDLYDIAAGRTIQGRYAAFLARCPDVYPMFVEVALDLRRRGFRRYSADGVGHIIRWRRATSGKDVEGFKMNNIYLSRMARQAMEEVPELAGFFEVRRLKTL